MSKGIAYIRTWYNVPANQGRVVRNLVGSRGTILHGRGGNYITVFFAGSPPVKMQYHPFELDYMVDGQWVCGADIKAKHDARIDAVNARWNEGGAE